MNTQDKYNIKSRCYNCGKTLKDLVLALQQDYGMNVTQSALSAAKSGAETGPRAKLILSNADKILKGWEAEMKEAKDNDTEGN
jgi:hypothetical protein